MFEGECRSFREDHGPHSFWAVVCLGHACREVLCPLADGRDVTRPEAPPAPW